MKPKYSEALYKSLFDNLLEGLAYCQMVFDAQGQPVDFIYLEVNQNFEKLTGLQDVAGKKVTEIIPGIKTSNPELFEIYGRVALTGRPEKFETYIEPLAIWLFISVYSPKKEFFVAVFQNITERKQIEKDLKNAKIAAQNVLEDLSIEKSKTEIVKARDEAMLSSIGDGLIAVDKDGKIILTNSAFEKLLGWSGKEVQGKIYFDVLTAVDENEKPVPKEKRPMIKTLLGKTTTTTTTTTRYKRKDGSVFPAATTVSPIIFKDTIVGVVEVFRDITREKEIDKAKTEFVSLASHQLRTPLTSINWYIEMFQSGDAGVLNDKQKEYFFEIYKSSRRMVQLINDLLSVSHLETGRLKIEAVSTDLIVFIQDMLKEFGPLAKEKGCKISLELPKREVEKINVDQILLRQVIANLLNNAINYSSVGGKGQVKISLIESSKGYTIIVADNGIGIPKEVQGHIFEKFFRTDNAREVVPDGSGLGLYLTKQIIDSSGCTIEFSSPARQSPDGSSRMAGGEPGQGTTFYVTIPISGMIFKQ